MSLLAVLEFIRAMILMQSHIAFLVAAPCVKTGLFSSYDHVSLRGASATTQAQIEREIASLNSARNDKNLTALLCKGKIKQQS